MLGAVPQEQQAGLPPEAEERLKAVARALRQVRRCAPQWVASRTPIR